MRKTAETAKPSKRKLQACQGKFRESKHDSLSPEALQTQYKAYGLLLAMACYRIRGSHGYKWHTLKQEMFEMDIWRNLFPMKTVGARKRLPREVVLSLSMEVFKT